MLRKLNLRLLLWFISIAMFSTVSYGQKNKDLSPAEKQALQKAKGMYRQLQSGADFESLARLHSDDSRSAARGGNLGIARSGQIVPAYEKTALSLKPGEISKPVWTEFGFHIIQLLERNEEAYKSRHILILVK
jgi:peptidyl-prolyl cis-trans isomerase SurA